MAHTQTQLNTRIRQMESSFDSFSSVDADISVLENDISSTETRRDSLEQEIQEVQYDEQMRERKSTVSQKETERDKLNSELTALNRQADTRAQLGIKRNELESKNAQILASYVLPVVRGANLAESRRTRLVSRSWWAPISRLRRWRRR